MNGLVRTSIVLTASLLMLVLASGTLLHALIPHEHPHDTGAISLLHSSLRHEEQVVVLLPVVVFLWTAVFSLIAAAVIARAFASHALSSRAQSSYLFALSRGVFAYRRFG